MNLNFRWSPQAFSFEWRLSTFVFGYEQYQSLTFLSGLFQGWRPLAGSLQEYTDVAPQGHPQEVTKEYLALGFQTLEIADLS